LESSSGGSDGRREQSRRDGSEIPGAAGHCVGANGDRDGAEVASRVGDRTSAIGRDQFDQLEIVDELIKVHRVETPDPDKNGFRAGVDEAPGGFRRSATSKTPLQRLQIGEDALVTSPLSGRGDQLAVHLD
jgi:hypothetical protein